MILLWGLLEDGPLAAVHAALLRRGAPFTFIDQRREASYTLAIDDWCGSGRLFGPEVDLRLEDVRAVYARPYNFADLDVYEGVDAASEEWRSAARFEEAMSAWCDVTPALVVNRPDAMGSNTSKPFQMELIRGEGFLVPATLLTTDPVSVAAFDRRMGKTIFKSISSWRSIVHRYGELTRAHTDDVACCPTQFQGYVPGIDHRVHVLGNRIFAGRIESCADDYRYAEGTTIAAVELDPDVAARCIGLCGALGLVLAGVDLRRTPDGEWYCFEVNPSPGFTYFDRIADALADLLSAA